VDESEEEQTMTSRTSGSWSSFHRREDVLRAVVTALDARRDGTLPMDVDGVAQTFGDELNLVGALSLRWHTRLAGRIERELMTHPADPEDAVVAAWRATARELPGIRAVLDRPLDAPRDAPLDAPLDESMAAAVRTSTEKEHVLLAVMAGLAGAQDTAASRHGERLEALARADLRPAARPTPAGGRAASTPGLLERLRAALAA
jgi:hypothetical protein